MATLAEAIKQELRDFREGRTKLTLPELQERLGSLRAEGGAPTEVEEAAKKLNGALAKLGK